MLTTKKWRGFLALPDAVAGRCLTLIALGVASLVLVGCSPPGRRSLVEGERLIRDGRPALAIEPLKDAVALLATNAPACAQAWNYLGLAYHLAGRPAEAAQAYQTALAKDFNLVAARFNRGCLLLEQANYAGAINELTTYTTHRPQDADGWSRLGTAQLRARLIEGAERTFQRVLELNPTPPLAAETYNNLGLTYALRRRPTDAFRYFNAALKVQPNHPPALLNQAIVAQQQLNDRSLALQKYVAYLEVAGFATNATAVAALASQVETEARLRAAGTNAPPGFAATTNLAPRSTNALLLSRPLTPPSPPPTNQTAVAPPAKPPAVTNANVAKVEVPPAPVPPSQPRETPPVGRIDTAPSTAARPAAPTNLPPAEPPPPPVEVVQLTPEPEVKPAQDLVTPARPAARAPEGKAPTLAAAPSTATVSPRAATPATPIPAPPTVDTGAAGEPKKRSFVQKLNPLGWFGSKEKKEPPPPSSISVTPLPPPKATPSAAKPPSPTPTPKPEPKSVPPAAPPAAPPPSFARYAYLRPSPPAAGDRARAEEVFRRGLQAQKEGRPTEALAAYQGAVAEDASFFDAQYNLGVAAFDASRWPAALAAFESALALRPADANARLNLALSLDRAGYPVDAAAELETLVAATPENVDAHATLATLCAQKLGDKSKAREHYLKVLQLDPRHPQAAAIRRWLSNNR